ncbi:MAG TPA: thiamine pyrophosphate-dependent enzyme [Acidimicrobiales bacterium]|jgi:2-oxoisovalerate dehydrogenase E1 component|nr:thiamine pyrophosphate-dependent enzyme [Acidimicrobiales bacterium]
MAAPLHSPVTESSPTIFRGLPVEELVDDFRRACVSRLLDDREISLQKQSRVFFQISGAGHEALLLGLGRYLRPGYDWFFPYYRDRALMLALGVTPTEILLQAVGSSDDPASGGRQMPCHFGHRDLNVVTQSSPTGSQCLPAVGCAEASRYISRRDLPGCRAHGDELTYVSLGDGATSEGEFWESLNTACTLALPVLFIVADNGYAISVPVAEQSPASVGELVRGFRGLAVHTVDGCDYFAVREQAAAVVAAVRAGTGPALIHAKVTRPYSHSAADTQSKYRSADELADEIARDPISHMEHALVTGGAISAERASDVRAEARAIVADASRAALAAARPDPASIMLHVTDLPRVPPEAEDADDGTGEVVALGEAIKRTLHEQMAADERIRVFGEDVADAREAVLADVEGKGGVFGTTYGLQRRFGLSRCYNTPLAEANIVGRAIGQGIRGLRPVPEVQFFDYIWPAMTQIRSEAATIRWRSNGAFSCPMVLRVAIGGYLTGGAIWHSQSGESIFAHIPGLTVVMPSRARDAVGLLRTALSAEDPVMFLEHKHLLRQAYTKDPFPSPDFRIPFGRGAVVQRGKDLTVVTWGATVERTRAAAARLGAGHDVEIIDLRSIVPWDHDLVASSVAKTGRLLVVHEDTITAGFGAEVAAWAADECFADLDAPVRRVGALDTWVPYEPSLERAVLPQIDDIAEAVSGLLAF